MGLLSRLFKKQNNTKKIIKTEAVSSESSLSKSDNTNDSSNQEHENITSSVIVDRFSLRDCLKQQTTHYASGDAFLLGSGNDNDYYLLNYHPRTFYIYKIGFDNNGKVKITHDYRKKGFEFITEFSCEYLHDHMKIHIKTSKDEVEDFIIAREYDTEVNGVRIIREQIEEFISFSNYIPNYMEWAKMNAEIKKQQEHKMSDLELRDIVMKLDPSKSEKFITLAKNGELNEAIKECASATGLGLAYSKRIIEMKLYC